MSSNDWVTDRISIRVEGKAFKIKIREMNQKLHKQDFTNDSQDVENRKVIIDASC